MIRPATATDLPELCALREANAAAHLALDPRAYRIPERAAVERHFRAFLADPARGVVLLEPGGGMVEIVRNPPPPDHQILRPLPSAQIHTVVHSAARGHGTGARLVAAAHRWAAAQGIAYLTAGIHHANAGAVRFYARHGYTPSGAALIHHL
ncbi:GNAT family N-acetyltransferase [Symbioplanes lichenis]|uniref:GNAT family N-acetyltransferase n=1 Tax=Symbioplanes lichenis TaxID=1629072 RepID=UPI002738EBA2|nr:GNAT family N-acetyltransferase [Actinoplanes lichenis]